MESHVRMLRRRGRETMRRWKNSFGNCLTTRGEKEATKSEARGRAQSVFQRKQQLNYNQEMALLLAGLAVRWALFFGELAKELARERREF